VIERRRIRIIAAAQHHIWKMAGAAYSIHKGSIDVGSCQMKQGDKQSAKLEVAMNVAFRGPRLEDHC
jgi:hypothetical protein